MNDSLDTQTSYSFSERKMGKMHAIKGGSKTSRLRKNVSRQNSSRPISERDQPCYDLRHATPNHKTTRTTYLYLERAITMILDRADTMK